ncbi:MAG: indole-3-glycerol phosphate synthase TrpC [Crocinitomicaceae bacterium]|nr:indole-3-glycerol phosphate synthase TrpC [Crocinitomicaceae bacterium]
MKLLDKIIQTKRGEVSTRMNQTSLQEIQERENYARSCYSMKQSILEGTGIIAEFKRQSPSKGIIHENADPKQISEAYFRTGVSGISVLTDGQYFGGADRDFTDVRNQVSVPLLRKDFIIDSYQIHESKALGADVILLIARILTPDLVQEFTEIAHNLGMEVLLETHAKTEIASHYFNEIDLIGINNRDLDTFQVDIDRSILLAQQLPEDTVKIAESGLSDPETVLKLRNNGFDGFLMGEVFMKEKNPGQACKKFLEQLNPIAYEN